MRTVFIRIRSCPPQVIHGQAKLQLKPTLISAHEPAEGPFETIALLGPIHFRIGNALRRAGDIFRLHKSVHSSGHGVWLLPLPENPRPGCNVRSLCRLPPAGRVCRIHTTARRWPVASRALVGCRQRPSRNRFAELLPSRAESKPQPGSEGIHAPRRARWRRRPGLRRRPPPPKLAHPQTYGSCHGLAIRMLRLIGITACLCAAA